MSTKQIEKIHDICFIFFVTSAKLLEKKSLGQFWKVLEVPNRCQHRPCQTCENGVFALAKRKIPTSRGGPEATKKNFGGVRSRLQKEKIAKMASRRDLEKDENKHPSEKVCQKRVSKKHPKI